MGRRRTLLAAGLVLALVARVAGAIDAGPLSITAVPPADPQPASHPWAVYLDGYIDPGAAGRLAGLMQRAGIRHAVVFLNSPGGSLLAAMDLGRLLRAGGFDTNVGRRAPDGREPEAGVCYSSCPFAYAGGVRRSLLRGSALGVHRPRNLTPVVDPQAFERRVSADATDYLEGMGVNPVLASIMAQAPHDAIRLVGRGEAERLALVND